MMKTIIFICGLVLFLAPISAQTQQEQKHDHDHSHSTTQPAVELTLEQVLAPVIKARDQYKGQRLVVLKDFAKQVSQALAIQTDTKIFKQLAVLREKLDQDIKAVNENQYVSEYAGSEKEFKIKFLKEQQKSYVKALDDADKTYADAVKAALKNDQQAYIGKMVLSGVDQCIDIN